MKHIAYRVQNASIGSAPGPSGWRNGHWQAVFCTGPGRNALLKVGQAIAMHRAPVGMMEVRLHHLACPLDKGGGKVRPIVLSETIIRILMAALFGTQEKAIQDWMHKDEVDGHRLFKQFANMKSDGISEYLMHVQELAGSRSQACFISLDVSNAFWVHSPYEGTGCNRGGGTTADTGHDGPCGPQRIT